MTEYKLYIIDDMPDKRASLPMIIKGLNQRLASKDISFEEGFQNEDARTLCNAEALIKACEDNNGLILLDLHMPDAQQLDTADNIFEILEKHHQSDVIKHFRTIEEKIGSEEKFYLASLIFALCRANNTKCFFISTDSRAFDAKTFKFLHTDKWAGHIPYPETPEKPITETVNAIEAACLADIYLDWDSFVSKTFIWTHDECASVEAADQLRRFLRLNHEVFNTYFTDINGRPFPATIKALKSIGGVAGGEQYDGRCLMLHGAWLLGLGYYRDRFGEEHDWVEVWQPNTFLQAVNDDGATDILMQGEQTLNCRSKSLDQLKDLFDKIFPRENSDNEPILCEVKLTIDSLSFFLDFPFEPLRKTIVSCMRSLRGEEIPDALHGTARAIVQFWISASFTDKNSDSGVIFPAIVNILPHKGGSGTELRFGGDE